MSPIREALRGAAVLAASLICIGAASAQNDAPPTPPTSQQVVHRCLEQMADITQTTISAIHERTERGVGAIGGLAQNGAEPPQILRAGQTAKAHCAMAARRGQDALNTTLDQCLRALDALGAPRQAFAILIEARRRAGLAIGDALTTCHRRVNHALARALDLGAGDEPGQTLTTDTPAAALLIE